MADDEHSLLRSSWPFWKGFLCGVLLLAAGHIAIHSWQVAGDGGDWLEEILGLVALSFLGLLVLFENARLRRHGTFLEVEQRRLEKISAERMTYLDSLIEYNPLAIVVLDSENRVRFCNPAFESLFRYANADIVGCLLDDLIAPEDKIAEAQNHTANVLAGQSVHQLTTRRRQDGSLVNVELFGVPLSADGELIGIFGLYMDITDRVQAEQAVRDSQERFRWLADATFEGIVISEDGVIVDCNEQYAQMIGLRPRQVVGRAIVEFVDPRDRDMVTQRWRDEVEQPYEHRAVRDDGKPIIVEVHGRTLSHQGKQMRVVAVRDVTQHKRFEEEVRQSQKMEAVGRLAGGIAHDFNNLLTVIKGYGQLLELTLAEGDRARSSVTEILQAAERAALMTQRLLAFGRKQPTLPQLLEPAAVLEGMEKMLRRLIRADIDIQLLAAAEVGRVQMDRGQLEQVVLNLAINAGDAMPKGGVLTITSEAIELTADEAARCHVSPGTFMRLSVRDTGLGMDEETLSQVFEPFFTTKEAGRGTGLGLATVYGIVQQSGGMIDVSSEVGAGTCFHVYLPRVPARESGEDSAATSIDLPRGDEVVLVVEDQPGVLGLAVEFLRRQGFSVLEADQGRRGLALIEEQEGKIDLVLTDVVMPVMNGPALADEIRQRFPDIRVLFMSGYTDEILGHETAAANLVRKPFSIEELLFKVRQALDDIRPAQQGSALQDSVLQDSVLQDSDLQDSALQDSIDEGAES